MTGLPRRLDAPAWDGLRIAELRLRLIEEPLAQPVQTSFGTMRTRPGLLLRLDDAAGRSGYGEVWGNFPRGGARYKAALVADVVRPAVRGLEVARPQDVQARARGAMAVLALQCGDRGAFEQVLAGLDQAAWDLFCKVRGMPLWQLMGGERRVPVYASGIGPARVAETVAAMRDEGHLQFKLKLGFGDERDRANLQAALAALPAGGRLMVDVNQGWTPKQAQAWLPRLAEAGIAWCEEPLRADTPWPAWRALADAAPALRIAAGENLMDESRFLEALTEGGIRVLQPDLGKWGGLSGALALAARWPAGDAWLCPHWLAGGVGLAASLQFKAAVGGDGPVEVDANPNPQRSEAFASPLALRDGAIELPDTPGLVPPLAERLRDEAAWVAQVD